MAFIAETTSNIVEVPVPHVRLHMSALMHKQIIFSIVQKTVKAAVAALS